MKFECTQPLLLYAGRSSVRVCSNVFVVVAQVCVSTAHALLGYDAVGGGLYFDVQPAPALLLLVVNIYICTAAVRTYPPFDNIKGCAVCYYIAVRVFRIL